MKEKLKDGVDTYVWLDLVVFPTIMILIGFGLILSVGIFVVGVFIFKIHWVIVVPIIIVVDIVAYYFLYKLIRERERIYGGDWLERP